MKKLISALCILLFSVSAFSQIGTNIPNVSLGNSKWTFGGYAGLGGAFGGSGGTSIYLTPRVGYKVDESFELGLATNFTWSTSKYYSATNIGIGPFMNYYFGRNIYINGTFQEYFVNQKDKINNTTFSTNEAALYLGGGYMQKLGEHVYMQIGGMYNVLYKADKSVFGGGFVPNIGIVYGL